MSELTKDDIEDFVRELIPTQAEMIHNIVSQDKIRVLFKEIYEIFGIGDEVPDDHPVQMGIDLGKEDTLSAQGPVLNMYHNTGVDLDGNRYRMLFPKKRNNIITDIPIRLMTRANEVVDLETAEILKSRSGAKGTMSASSFASYRILPVTDINSLSIAGITA